VVMRTGKRKGRLSGRAAGTVVDGTGGEYRGLAVGGVGELGR